MTGAAYRSHPPMRPLPTPSSRPMQHSRAFFIDARGGADSDDGAERSPWRSLAHALTQIGAGDSLYLRGGTYYEQVSIASVGNGDAPITIRSYPGELAVIDGGIPEFFESPRSAWERVPGDVPDLFRSVRPYRNMRCALGWFGDSMVPMLTYQHRCDIEERDRVIFEQQRGARNPLPVYLGPGLWFDASTGHVFARLSPTRYEMKHPGFADYRGAADPRELPIVVAPYNALPLRLAGAEHVILQDLVVRGGGENTVILQDCQSITFDNVVIYAGTYGLRSRSSGPVKFLHSAVRGGVSPWFVHSAGCLRNIPGPRNRHDPESGRNTSVRDVTRLNTHVLVAIEGRTEDMVDYAFPGNHHWEFAYSDFTDGFDGIHLSGECFDFHHNRIDRLFDDALYLTPLTMGYLDNVHVYQNLFTRCQFPFGFGGLSESGGAIYLYRNVIDMRVGCVATHGKVWTSGSPLIGHFRSVEAFDFGPLYVYQNTIVSNHGPRHIITASQDPMRTFALGMLSFTRRDKPRRVFNNLFVYLDGMIAPEERSLPKIDEDLQMDGNVHWDVLDSKNAAATKLRTFLESKLFQATRQQYPPGWEASARVGDPRFVTFSTDVWASNDYRPRADGVAIAAGIALPPEWDDPLRASGDKRPDAGALPLGAEALRVGRNPGNCSTDSWLERSIDGTST